MKERRGSLAWLYDDFLTWLTPGGLLVTAFALRFPQTLEILKNEVPELILPTWFVAAYALGFGLSPLGRIVYALAQAMVWPSLRTAWTPAIKFLSEKLKRNEGLSLPDPGTMSVHVFHDVDRRLREYVEAADHSSREMLHRMKVLCRMSCNTAASCVVFVIVDVLAGNAATWRMTQVAIAALIMLLAFLAAVYQERRRQRTQLSIWRREILRTQQD